MIEEIVQILKSREKTLGLVESCTGGLLSAEFVHLAGVSAIYRGGIVSYDYRVKEKLLGIPHGLLVTHGAVSRPIALAMARAGRLLLDADYSCAITGIAGPGGGTPEKPVGTVCFGLVGPGFEYTWQKHFSGAREQVQRQSVQFMLACLKNELLGTPPGNV